MSAFVEPVRIRPDIPKEYGVSNKPDGMLDWSWVSDQLKQAKHYWLVSTYPDGRPHTVPSWGAWVDNKLYFSGGDMTRHHKNLLVNPGMIAHLESGSEVVIVYGTAQPAVDVPREIMAEVEADYTKKYGMPEGATFALVPEKVLAWTDFGSTPTKFIFEGLSSG
jgi:hypothetical protein